MNYKFSIIIPHINEGYLLNIMLDSIFNYFKYENYEIIIVDDGSDNIDDLNFINTHFLKDKIKIYFEKGLGSPGARNFGAKNANGDILIFLDSHMYFNNDFLYELNNLLNKFNDIDLLQPIIGSIRDKKLEGMIYKIKDLKLNSTWDLPRINGKEIEKNNLFPIIETPNIAGGATIIKKEIFNKLNGFNTHFIKWGCEDLEFSMRAWLNGYKCFFTADLFVAHYFKDSFTNTVIETEQVLNNRIMFAFTCFSGNRQSQILDAISKDFGEELYLSVYNKIISNDLFLIWKDKQIEDFKYDDNRYFEKFKDYYDLYFNL